VNSGNVRTARVGRPKSTAKREAIASAAVELFLQKGFKATSMDDIAASAGVSKQTVYSHFGNKDDLYRGVIASKCQEYRITEEMLPACSDLREALCAIGQRYLALIADPAVIAMYRVVICESLRHPKTARLFHSSGPASGRRAVERFLERNVRDGRLAIDDLESAATQLLATLRGDYQLELILNLRGAMDEVERARTVARAVDQFLLAYGNPRPAAHRQCQPVAN